MEGAFPVHTPSIIVQGANDPLGNAQAHAAFAALFATESRVEIGHQSGHIPFPPSIEETSNLTQAIEELSLAVFNRGAAPESTAAY